MFPAADQLRYHARPMEPYRLLDWDSRFFGFTVAQITAPSLDAGQLASVLEDLRRKAVRLAYWPASAVVGFAADLGGRLVDEKTTFLIDLAGLPAGEAPAGIEPYSASMPLPQLRSLAIQSGLNSRFAVDPQLPREKFIELYTIWITRSLSKEIADEVLVVRDGEAVAGMITLGNKNGRGDIGLVAVDEAYRGRKFGQALVLAAQRWFAARGYRHSQVVTQGANTPACNLYRKCGYAVEKVEPYYHFWL